MRILSGEVKLYTILFCYIHILLKFCVCVCVCVTYIGNKI